MLVGISVIPSPALSAFSDCSSARPLILDRNGRITAEIAWIGPQLPVPVEVRRREQIDLERLHAIGHFTGQRRAVVLTGASVVFGAQRLQLARISEHRRATADTFEVNLRSGLGERRGRERRYRRGQQLYSPLPYKMSDFSHFFLSI